MASFKVDSVVVLFTMVVVLLLAINCGAGEVHTPSGGEEVVGDPHKYEDAKLKADDQQAREKASETNKDQASDTWTEWAKEKLNEGLGLAKDNVQDASNYVTHSAKKSTDTVQDTTYATGEYGAEKAGDNKNKATEKACEIKNKASDKAGDIKDSSTGKADEIKKKASTDQEEAKHSSMETGKSAIEESEEQLRKAAEKAKHGSDQSPKGKAGETLEATKERLDANYEAAKKKTQDIKERLAGGGRDGDEEL